MAFFDYVYSVVFPAIGGFFGQLIGIASTTGRQFGLFLRGEGSLSYTNIMTGTVYSLKPIKGLDFLNALNWTSLLFENNALGNAPLWVLFLTATIGLFFVLAIVRFIIHIIL